MDEQKKLIKLFPHIIANHNFSRYEGFIDVEGTYIKLSIQVPNYPSLENISLQCSQTASILLASQNHLIIDWIQKGTLCGFLENLKYFLALQMKSKVCEKLECVTAESFKLLMSDLSKIGFSNVVFISSSLTEVQLRTVDAAKRIHTITVNVGRMYPNQAIEIHATLPDKALDVIKKNTSIEKVYCNFVQQVSHLQYVWNVLDTIDTYCYVLDPEQPTRKDMSRRFIIDKNVSIYCTMNYEEDAPMPSMTVLGPEQAVEHYQSTLARNKEVWDSDKSVLENLKLVLELTSLPGRSTGNEISLVQQGECLICFALLMDGEMPGVVCEDTVCGSIFHTSCLFQWLQSIPGNFQSFNRIHGACPNCSMPIACQIPKLR